MLSDFSLISWFRLAAKHKLQVQFVEKKSSHELIGSSWSEKLSFVPETSAEKKVYVI